MTAPGMGPRAALMPFRYGDTPVRVVMIDGEPWFVLADLCKVLGLVRAASAVAERLEDGVRQAYPIADSLGRSQQATVVNEAGMYEVVIRSDKPEAVAFRRWVTGTVLPEIRRTGGFNTTPALPDRRELARMVIEAEDRADEAERLRVIERKGREAAESYAKELEPKAQYVDDFVSTDDCILFRTLANQLGMQETALRDFLTQKHRIYRQFIGRRFSKKAGKLVDEYEWRAYADYVGDSVMTSSSTGMDFS